ncbi:hypothetical protein DPV78_012705, partial [Talaromyces pinophilus]
CYILPVAYSIRWHQSPPPTSSSTSIPFPLYNLLLLPISLIHNLFPLPFLIFFVPPSCSLYLCHHLLSCPRNLKSISSGWIQSSVKKREPRWFPPNHKHKTLEGIAVVKQCTRLPMKSISSYIISTGSVLNSISAYSPDGVWVRKSRNKYDGYLITFFLSLYSGNPRYNIPLSFSRSTKQNMALNFTYLC